MLVDKRVGQEVCGLIEPRHDWTKNLGDYGGNQRKKSDFTLFRMVDIKLLTAGVQKGVKEEVSG